MSKNNNTAAEKTPETLEEALAVIAKHENEAAIKDQTIAELTNELKTATAIAAVKMPVVSGEKGKMYVVKFASVRFKGNQVTLEDLKKDAKLVSAIAASGSGMLKEFTTEEEK
jgi:hypothetical protein